MTRLLLYLALLPTLNPLSATAGDWPMYGHDPARSGWASEEKGLTPESVSHLRLQWKAHMDNKSLNLAALTAPVAVSFKGPDGVVRSRLYVVGASGTVFALDAETGTVVWSKILHSMALPGKGGFQGTYLCPNAVTATPAIDRDTQTIYVIAADGSLIGLDLETGKSKFGPLPFVAPFTKSWSLNLVDGIIYTTVSLGCGGGRAGIYAADIRDPKRPSIRQLLLSNSYTAGIWGRGGAVIGGNHLLYGGTADGDTAPEKGDYSNAVVAASIDDFTVKDYFLPRNWSYLKKMDLDVGSASPVWFTWKKRSLLAHGFKEGVVYLFDGDKIGGSNHETPLFASPRLGNDAGVCCNSPGIWGGLSVSQDDNGQTWLYIPMGGPPAVQAPSFPITNGDNPHGSIMAFKIVDDPAKGGPLMQPAWISGDFQYPDPAVIAHGVLFALSNGENPDQHQEESRRLMGSAPAVLKALDARTGKELFNSHSVLESWVHFSALAIADSRVFVVDHSSNVYCFGLDGGAVASASAGPRVDKQPDELANSWIGRAERQNEFLTSWIKRISIAAGLVLVLTIAGIWAGVRDERKTEHS